MHRYQSHRRPFTDCGPAPTRRPKVEDQALGRSCGGLSTKIPCPLSMSSATIGILLTPGSVHEFTSADALLPQTRRFADRQWGFRCGSLAPSRPAGKSAAIHLALLPFCSMGHGLSNAGYNSHPERNKPSRNRRKRLNRSPLGRGTILSRHCRPPHKLSTAYQRVQSQDSK